MNTDRWKKAGRILPTAAALFLILVISCFNTKLAKAAGNSISVKEINYLDSSITLQLNDGDTAVYFSDSKKKTWEEVPGEISSSNTITMDISWVPTSKNYVMTFKGNKSTNIISVTLPKQNTSFKATFNKVKGTVIFKNQGTHTIEWRKKDSSIWNAVNTSTLSTELSYLYNNGATIIFRLVPVNGTGISSVGFRGSKEISVSIPKKASAPDIKVNGSKFSISVKKGMAYRTVNSDGSTSDWTIITSSSDLLLKNIAAKAMYTNASTVQSAVILQFRTNATSKVQVSRISTVTVPIQEGPPKISTCGISMSYASSSTISLQVKAASSSIPFEYAVIEKDMELNYQTTKWTTISSSAAVTLDDDAAPAGCHIYIRKKTIDETDSTDFKLASVETEITGTTGLVYPDAPKASTLTTLISTAGVCQTTNSSSYLTFQLYSPTSTTVTSIEFLDTYGIDKGAVTCKSSVTKNPSSAGTNDKYIITTKITSTSEIDQVTEEKLYAKVTLADSDVIKSSDTAGILLYLYPSSVINNPTDDGYTNNFYRIYQSNVSDDDSSFKFKIDLGAAKIADTKSIGSFTSENVAINSMKYDGYTLIKDTDYTVVYGTYVNDDDKTIATATVTVNVSRFENSSLIDTTNEVLPLIINLNNGEILNEDVGITLINTATIDEIPIAWSITQGSLKETTTKTTTNSDGTTTKVTEDVITYTISLTLFDKNYSVGISDVTWGGVSIFGSATISGGKATINLSNAKINKLMTSSTETQNIVITLSNGFVIKTGCKLTILKAL